MRLRRWVFNFVFRFSLKDFKVFYSFVADHNVYVWKLPPIGSSTGPEAPHLVLKGHRSLVCSVQYNNATGLLASCGMEKLVKIWSAVPLPNSTGGLDELAASSHQPRLCARNLDASRSRLIDTNMELILNSTEEDLTMLEFADVMLEMRADSSDEEEHFCSTSASLVRRFMDAFNGNEESDQSSQSDDDGDTLETSDSDTSIGSVDKELNRSAESLLSAEQDEPESFDRISGAASVADSPRRLADPSTSLVAVDDSPFEPI